MLLYQLIAILSLITIAFHITLNNPLSLKLKWITFCLGVAITSFIISFRKFNIPKSYFIIDDMRLKIIFPPNPLHKLFVSMLIINWILSEILFWMITIFIQKDTAINYFTYACCSFVILIGLFFIKDIDSDSEIIVDKEGISLFLRRIKFRSIPWHKISSVTFQSTRIKIKTKLSLPLKIRLSLPLFIEMHNMDNAKNISYFLNSCLQRYYHNNKKLTDMDFKEILKELVI